MSTKLVLGVGSFKISLNKKKDELIIELAPLTILDLDENSNLRELEKGDQLVFKSKKFKLKKSPEEFKV